jgi:hypothetical protein
MGNLQKYNTELFVKYTNNDEYRACIQRAFLMEFHLAENTNVLYDNKQIVDGIDYLYDATKTNPLFVELYEKTAENILIISNNTYMGITVLFSYDFFYLFHPCICSFIRSPENFTNQNADYLALKNSLLDYFTTK